MTTDHRRRGNHRSIGLAALAAAIGVAITTIGVAPAFAQGGSSVPPSQVPINPCLFRPANSPCYVTSSHKFSHVKSHNVWAVTNFPNQMSAYLDVTFKLTCADGTSTTGEVNAALPAINPFGANGASNGTILLGATPGNNTVTSCTMTQKLVYGYTTTAVDGQVPTSGPQISDYVRFDNS